MKENIANCDRQIFIKPAQHSPLLFVLEMVAEKN